MLTINKTDLKELLLMEELSKLHAAESKLFYFEKKYGKSFEDFRQQVEKEEVFDQYDDFIEWKAFLDRQRSIGFQQLEVGSFKFLEGHRCVRKVEVLEYFITDASRYL